ncbi:MAG: alpha-glucan family phosphorylase [Candidatus Margulisiibacteriota bacterium]
MVLALNGYKHIPVSDRTRQMPGDVTRIVAPYPTNIRGERLTKAVFEREWAKLLRDNPEIGVHFSMEYYRRDGLPGGGGLGTLSADWVRGWVDKGLPIVTVSIAHHRLQFQKFGTDYIQQEHDVEIDLDNQPDLVNLGRNVRLKIQGKNVTADIYGTLTEGEDGRVGLGLKLSVKNCKLNGFGRIDESVYPGNHRDKFATFGQEMILGIGGIRALREMGLNDSQVKFYHVNDGHAALMLIELAREAGLTVKTLTKKAMEGITQKLFYSCHTLVLAAMEIYDPLFINEMIPDPETRTMLGMLGSRPVGDEIKSLDDSPVQRGDIAMTEMMMAWATQTQGVSQDHARLLRRSYPQFANRISGAVTNAVHNSWAAPSIAAFFDRYAEGWRKNPSLLVGIKDHLHDVECRQAVHQACLFAGQDLIDMVALLRPEVEAAGLDPEIFAPTDLHLDWLRIGNARRWPTYKRGNLMFQHPDDLAGVFGPERPLQLFYAGKAHRHDDTLEHRGAITVRGGKYILKETLEALEYLSKRYPKWFRCVYFPNYDVNIARTLIPGVHAWLNTPLYGEEASGTSTMDAILSLVLLISVLDGCVPEIAARGNFGWGFGKTTPGGSFMHYEEDYQALMHGVLPQVAHHFYSAQKSGAFESGAPCTWVDWQMDLCGIIPYVLMPRLITEYNDRMWGLKAAA